MTQPINYLLSNNLPHIVFKVIVDHCTGTDCMRLSVTCKGIRETITNIIQVEDSLIPFIDPNLDLLYAPINTLTRGCFWKNYYLCFPAIKFDTYYDDWFEVRTDKRCVLNDYQYLSTYVWEMEMGQVDIKNVPIGDYDVYWRIKVDKYSKALQFHCSANVDGQVYSFTMNTLDYKTIEKNTRQWCIYKTNKISMTELLSDDDDDDNSKRPTTMRVRCIVYNADEYRMSDLHIDCFHIVPKDRDLFRETLDHPSIIDIKQQTTYPLDSKNDFSHWVKQNDSFDFSDTTTSVPTKEN
ncbi:hypothetical protein CYY_007615 [Polysphondylium violaceum]|uniref:F-box domain-containing protein n=1 Tax=Polysphondylium violaceum TaxID=133409 RepID=A0A8J4PQJ7_9MYCE|nr:hypothetical protein CYY_007615 [Polysphondylium violaceum]